MCKALENIQVSSDTKTGWIAYSHSLESYTAVNNNANLCTLIKRELDFFVQWKNKEQECAYI